MWEAKIKTFYYLLKPIIAYANLFLIYYGKIGKLDIWIVEINLLISFVSISMGYIADFFIDTAMHRTEWM